MKKQEQNTLISQHKATITLLVGLMFIFFSMSFISSWEFDNLKTYDEETKTITITNSFLLLYPLGEVATIKLDTPLVYNVIMGKDRLVAEFTIDNFETYTEGVFDDMDFYNVKNNLNKFDRQFNYKYKSFYDVEISDYETVCEEKEVWNEINKTFETEKYGCEQIQTGTHLEQKVKWNSFNEKAELPKGEITLGIFTDVYANERVEWIPTLFGVKINEWAGWVENGILDDFNDAPDEVNLWTKDGGSVSSSGSYLIFSLGAGAGTTYANFTADKSLAVDFNQDINIYTKLDKYGAAGGDTIGGFDFGLIDESENVVYFYSEWGESPYDTSKIVKATVYPSDDIITYSVDGGSQTNVSVSSLVDGDEWHYKFRIGEQNANVNIHVDYVNYSTSEVISIEYPTNTTYDQSQTELNYSVTGTADSCWYSLDDGDTNSSRQDWGLNWTGLTSTEGSNTWTVYCNNSENELSSEEVTFIIDTTPPTISISYPLNITYTTDVSDLNYTYTEINCDSVWYSLDSGITNSSRENCGTNFTTLTSTEGSNTWTVYINDSANNENNKSTTFFKDSINPDINITSPTNNTNSTDNTLNINYTTSDTNLDSCWYSNDTMSLNTTITCGENITSITWSDGEHNVTIWANDTFNNFNSSSITFEIDTILPTINITYPTGQISSHALGNNLSTNWTISDTNLDSCWLDYNSINTTLTCGDNNFSFTPVSNKQDLIIWANDTFGHINFNTTSWTYNFLENNATFNSTSYETSQETFVLNMTTDLTVLSIDSVLNYNGTEYASTASCSNKNCLLSNTFDLPLISSATNELNSFHWNFTIFNGSDSIETISSSRTQNVSVIHLEQCNTTYITKTLNFTVYDEQNLSQFSQFQFDGTFDFWIGSGTVKKNNSFSKNVSEMNLCLSPNTTIKTDATIDYDEVTTANYTNRFYYFDEYLINHTLQHIDMYLLKSASATSFILKVQDENLLPVADALIEIHRYYTGEGIYRIVQIAKTDDNGKSVGFFETETVDYKFIIKKNGETLLTTGKQKVIPEVSPFTLTFNTGTDLGEPWSSQADIPSLESSLSFDADTGIVTYIYVDSSTNFTQARLFVQKQSLANSTAYTTICNDTSTLSSSTMTCSVGNESGFYIASSYIKRTGEALDLQITFQIETFSSVAGLLGLFFGWFLILIASFMFKFNEIAGIWATTVTIFLVNLIGLIKFGAVFVTAIIGIAIILTWLMEK